MTKLPVRMLALAGAGLVGLSVLGSPAPLLAQRSGATVETPFGRAPLSFADLVDKVKPSVVSIHVTAGGARAQPKAGGRGGQFPDLPDDHPLNEFFKNLPKEFRGQPNPGPSRPALAQGSGFVISADGYVVTNNHVIDNATRIQVAFDDQTKYDADLVGTDARTDVALLKIKAPGKTFPFVKFADKQARVGDWVLAVGNPFGLGGTVTAGIVSALARDIGSGPYDFLQIDAAVNRGNSGGPTFNLEGEVVGVNTAIYSPSGGNVGIAFAVPAKTASEVLAKLRSGGSVTRGWLGVKIENIDEDKAAGFGLKEAKGALITEVTAGGPAASSALRAGDVVVAVNGQKIDSSRDLARKIAELQPDATVNLDVFRYGKSEAIPVKLGTFPGNAEVAAKGTPPEAPKVAATQVTQLGLSLTQVPAAKGGGAREGVLISDVVTTSDAAAKGLSKGDIILEVQGQAVKSAADVEAGVKAAKDGGRKAVLLRVKSGEVVRFVAVQMQGS